MIIYLFFVLIICTGLFIILTSNNYVKKVIGLMIFQSSILILYLAIGKVSGGLAPFAFKYIKLFSNPLPQVLMLTAIVVGFASSALAFSIIIQIYKNYGTVMENEIEQEDL